MQISTKIIKNSGLPFAEVERKKIEGIAGTIIYDVYSNIPSATTLLFDLISTKRNQNLKLSNPNYFLC